MLESLFRAGFQIVDTLPDSEAGRSFMRRVHAGAYERVTEGPKAAPAAAPGTSPKPASPAAGFNNDPNKPGGA